MILTGLSWLYRNNWCNYWFIPQRRKNSPVKVDEISDRVCLTLCTYGARISNGLSSQKSGYESLVRQLKRKIWYSMNYFLFERSTSNALLKKMKCAGLLSREGLSSCLALMVFAFNNIILFPFFKDKILRKKICTYFPFRAQKECHVFVSIHIVCGLWA